MVTSGPSLLYPPLPRKGELKKPLTGRGQELIRGLPPPKRRSRATNNARTTGFYHTGENASTGEHVPKHGKMLEDSATHTPNAGGSGGDNDRQNAVTSRPPNEGERVTVGVRTVGSADAVGDDSVHQATEAEESDVTTELLCPHRATASPEHLRRLHVMTLISIGIIGAIIVAFMLVCVFYKNDRIFGKISGRRKKKPILPGLDMSLIVNTTLPAVPSIKISPGAGDVLAIPTPPASKKSGGGGAKRGPIRGLSRSKWKGKFFPTPKCMLMDIAPLLLNPGLNPLVQAEVLREATAAATTVAASAPPQFDDDDDDSFEVMRMLPLPGTNVEAVTSLFQPESIPEPTSMFQPVPSAGPSRPTRQHYDGSTMGHHNPRDAATGGNQSIYSCSKPKSAPKSPSSPPPQEDFDYYSSDQSSWYSDDESDYTGSSQCADNSGVLWDDDEGRGAVVHESYRGSRGVRGEKPKEESGPSYDYLDNYANSSLCPRRGAGKSASNADQSGPHEVSYMSGRFW